jgi:Flp pilus assembly pilin Flp
MSMKPPRSFYCRHYLQRAERRGQTLVEYALILAFIAIVAIAVLMSLGAQTKSNLAGVSVQLSKAQAGGNSGGTAH